jgi:hypothetical protein
MKAPRRADAVLLGYRERITLEAEELGRLGAVARARPLILNAWSVCTGQMTPTQAVTAAAKTKELTGQLATRVRAAAAKAERLFRCRAIASPDLAGTGHLIRPAIRDRVVQGPSAAR